MVKRMKIEKREHKGMAVWMTAGDPRRRSSSNDRLLFCVSTALAFLLARAGSSRGFSVSILNLGIGTYSGVLLYFTIVITRDEKTRTIKEMSVLNANVIKDIDSNFSTHTKV